MCYMVVYLLIRDRLLRDVGFFQSRISKVDGARDIGEYICNAVKEKPVAQASEPTNLRPELWENHTNPPTSNGVAEDP